MRNSFWLSLVAATMLTGPVGAAPPVAEPGANRARDGDIAIGQELCAARKKGTVAAYDLFIARHPRHPLAKVARDQREKLLSKER